METCPCESDPAGVYGLMSGGSRRQEWKFYHHPQSQKNTISYFSISISAGSRGVAAGVTQSAGRSVGPQSSSCSVEGRLGLSVKRHEQDPESERVADVSSSCGGSKAVLFS